MVFLEVETESPTTAPPTTESTPDDLNFYEGCDTTKTCFGIGDGDCVRNRRCNTVGAVIYDGGRFYFEMRSLGKSSDLSLVKSITKVSLAARARYVAIALSYDQKMGRDAVIECVNDAGRVRTYSSVTSVMGQVYSSPRTAVCRYENIQFYLPQASSSTESNHYQTRRGSTGKRHDILQSGTLPDEKFLRA